MILTSPCIIRHLFTILTTFVFLYLYFSNAVNSVDYFDVLDAANRPVLTERDILRNLQAIVADADTTPVNEVGFFDFLFVTNEA